MAEGGMDPGGWLRKQLQEADRDLPREMVRVFVENLRSATSGAMCSTSYAEWSETPSRDKSIATSVLDRLLHHSTTITIKVQSY